MKQNRLPPKSKIDWEQSGYAVYRTAVEAAIEDMLQRGLRSSDCLIGAAQMLARAQQHGHA